MKTGLPGTFRVRYEYLNLQQDIMENKLKVAEQHFDEEAARKFRHHLSSINKGMERLFKKHGAY